MYHKASISPLTATQISKILNGHSVRIKAGNGHDIELSKEQLKKYAKAYQTGKAMTIALDPYQIQNHQHLRGSIPEMSKGVSSTYGMGVGRRNKYNKWVDALGARQVIDAGMSKGASSISGMGVGRRNKYNKWVDALGARDLINAGMSKGASTILGFGLKKRGRPKRGGALYPAGIPN